MTLRSPFENRIWEKHPIYLTDEQHDNLDDEPQQPRNTTKTLSDELAAVCDEDNPFDDGPRNTKFTGPRPGSIPSGPRKRVKAHIGKKFLERKQSTGVSGNQEINTEKGRDTNNDTGSQGASPATGNQQTGGRVLTKNTNAENSKSPANFAQLSR